MKREMEMERRYERRGTREGQRDRMLAGTSACLLSRKRCILYVYV